MPRNRERTTEIGTWSIEDLNSALKSVEDRTLSMHKAAEKYKIPYSTLRKKYAAKHKKNQPLHPPRLGRTPVFPHEQEKVLADQLTKTSNLLYGLSSKQIRSVAYECAEKLHLKHNFDNGARLAGSDWLQGFLKRNPGVSVRKLVPNAKTTDEPSTWQIRMKDENDLEMPSSSCQDNPKSDAIPGLIASVLSAIRQISTSETKNNGKSSPKGEKRNSELLTEFPSREVCEHKVIKKERVEE